MRLSKDGTAIAGKNFTEKVPTYNTIWLHDSKSWITDSKDAIKAELTK